MLHSVQLTPTQRAAKERRNAFNAKTGQAVEARKPPPPIVVDPAPITLNITWSKTFGWPDYQVKMGFSADSKKRRTVLEIVAATAAHFEMSKDELLSDRRHQFLITPRHVAMYIASVHTLQSTTAIGRTLGDRDHTTVIHGVRSIQSRVLFHDADVINALDEIATMLCIKL